MTYIWGFRVSEDFDSMILSWFQEKLMELLESCTWTSGNKKIEDSAQLVVKPAAKA